MATSTGDEGEAGDPPRDADRAGADGERAGESVPPGSKTERNRKRAALYVSPFLAIGLFDLVLLLQWGLEPLWAFAILPPILFCSTLAWIVFSTGFLEDRT